MFNSLFFFYLFCSSFLYFKKNSPNGIFYDGKRDIDSIDAYLYEFYIHRNDPSSEPLDV